MENVLTLFWLLGKFGELPTLLVKKVSLLSSTASWRTILQAGEPYCKLVDFTAS